MISDQPSQMNVYLHVHLRLFNIQVLPVGKLTSGHSAKQFKGWKWVKVTRAKLKSYNSYVLINFVKPFKFTDILNITGIKKKLLIWTVKIGSQTIQEILMYKKIHYSSECVTFFSGCFVNSFLTFTSAKRSDGAARTVCAAKEYNKMLLHSIKALSPS